MAGENKSLDTKVLLEALVGLRNGDFTVRLPMERAGLDGKIVDTFNEEVMSYGNFSRRGYLS